MSGAAVMRAARGNPPGTPRPVTVSISRHVKPGKVAEYDAWLHEMTAMASRRPGYHGATVLRPRHGGDRPQYTTILHFDTEANLTAWMTAPERAALLKRVDDLTDEPQDEIIFETGMEYWFTPENTVTVSGRPPPRWKMAIVLTAVVFVMLQLTRRVLGPLYGSVPVPLVQLMSAAIQVVLLTYFVMPWLVRRLAFWLQPRQD